MTLDQLQIFVKVVQSGSFTRAAELLGASKGYLSRVVSQLEQELGAKLLERTTRAIAITETGKEVFERAVGILAAVEDTRRVTQDAQGEPRGVLRLTCGVEFGALAVDGWVQEYLARYPMTTVEVESTSRIVDLVHEGFDIAVRLGPLAESRLVARPLGALEYGLFACPRYLDRHGMPTRIEQLQEHSLVVFTAGTHRQGWTLRRGQGPGQEQVKVDAPARLRVNNSFSVRNALLKSLGIGMLPLLIAGRELDRGRLLPVLPDWAPAPVPVHAVYPSSRYLAPKVRGFIDLALAAFPQANDAAREAVQRRVCAIPPAPAA